MSTHTVIVQRAGRNASADYIGDSPGTVQEIHGGGNVLICGNPYPIPNYPGEPDWPASTFGGQVRVLPTVETYLMAGVFQVNPNFGGRSGFSWGRPGTTGVSVPVEAGYVPRFGANGLVGHHKLGLDYDSSRCPDLYQNGAGQLFVLSSASVIGRPKDSFGAIFHYIRSSGRLTATRELEAALGRPLTSGNFGPVYGVQSHEEVVELQYAAHVYGGVTVGPDFQCIIRPGATSAVHDAAVLGVRMNVQF